jgi:hypothetical protein
MTITSVAPSERSLVRFARPYLEVEMQSTSSLERAILRELSQASQAAKRKKGKGCDQPSSIPIRPVKERRFGGLGRGEKSVSM